MSGTILRGDDGSLYFIRDEVLTACKVEGEYLDRVQQMLAGEEAEVQGFSFNLAPATDSQFSSVKPVGYAQGSLLTQTSAAARQAGDTIMCPW
jgi:hypothetical protein